MRKTAYFYLSVLLLIINLDCIASTNKKEVIFSDITSIQVGNPWNNETQSKMYNINSDDKLPEVITTILFETPVSIIELGVEKLTSDFSYRAKLIAAHCKSKNSDTWAQVSCVSHSVNKTFKQYKWGDYTSFCRAHAQAFKQAFENLNIPSSLVSKDQIKTSSGFAHVFNRLIIASEDGRYFSFIIDVSWKPGTIFPDALITNQYFDINNDGVTDHFDLPKMNSPPVFSFQETCKPSSEDGVAQRLIASMRKILLNLMSR
ncbi:MAG: hypothetical protein HON90_08000 [Halobacteriovoraceae bacterium]|jgi:hypothetical protein|nr:hypothetical protein [Halobacteriovoraceae bacterium]